MHDAAIAVVVVDRVVLGAPVVPEGDRAGTALDDGRQTKALSASDKDAAVLTPHEDRNIRPERREAALVSGQFFR